MVSVLMYIPALGATPNWWIPAITLALAMGNAFFIAQMAYRAGLTRMPSIVPAFIYLITLGANTSLHESWMGQLLLMVLLVVLQLMQRSYHQEDVTEESFLATLLFLIASLFWTDVIFFLLVWVLGLVVEKHMGIRAIGAMLVALAIGGIYYGLAQKMNWPVPEWSGFIQRHSISFSGAFAQITELFLLGFTFYFVVASYLRINRDNVSVQKYLQMITIVLLPLLFCYVFPMPNTDVVSVFLPAIVAMASSIYFLSTATLTRGIVFSIYVLAIMCAFVMKVFIWGDIQ